MSTMQERINAPLEAFSRNLSPEQVLEALSKNIGIEYTEVDTSDWTLIPKNSPISISDIYSGFLKFRFSMKTFETQRFKEKSAKFFCEYLNNDGDGNERYRLGFENPTILVLKRNEDSKLHLGLKKGFTWGFYLNGFDFYREQNGQLVDITPSEKQFEHLYKARQAKERSCKAAHLDKKGFFNDLPPHQRKILG